MLWRKSSYSQPDANCVEVARLPNGGHAVRDSKNPKGPTICFTTSEWRSFVSFVKAVNEATIETQR